MCNIILIFNVMCHIFSRALFSSAITFASTLLTESRLAWQLIFMEMALLNRINHLLKYVHIITKIRSFHYNYYYTQFIFK